jgi:hypothetical protein
MHYLTHQFAHPETLARARRWLINAGITPDRMQVRYHGIPNLAVATEPGEVDGIEMVIRAAEMNDPDGLPGFWDLAKVHADGPAVPEEKTSGDVAAHHNSFELAWHPVDRSWDTGVSTNEVDLQRTYRDRRS